MKALKPSNSDQKIDTMVEEGAMTAATCNNTVSTMRLERWGRG
jgi:hypothetical protein